MSEVIKRIDEIGDAFLDARKKQDQQIDELKERLETIEAAEGRPRSAANDSGIDTKAFTQFLKTGDKSKLYESKTMTIGTAGDGGYTHIAQLGPEIIASVANINPIMRECTQVTIDANVYHQLFTTSRTGTGRAAESGSRSASTTAEFKQTSVTLFDLYSYPTISNELLNSSQFNLDAWIRNDITEAFNEALATEFVTGDGSTKSVGLLNSMSAVMLGASPELPWGSLYYVQESPNAVSYTGLLSMISALPVRYKVGGNCKWYMSTNAIEAARNLLDQNDLPIWRQDYGIAGAPMVLLGYPVVEVPQMDSTSYEVLFGDMKAAYAFISHRKGLGFIVDQITSPGNTKFYASLQCAGGVMDSRAMVALKC